MPTDAQQARFSSAGAALHRLAGLGVLACTAFSSEVRRAAPALQALPASPAA